MASAQEKETHETERQLVSMHSTGALQPARSVSVHNNLLTPSTLYNFLSHNPSPVFPVLLQLMVQLREYQKRCELLTEQEEELRKQLSLYSEKFEEFQETLSKSNSVFATFKKEMDKVRASHCLTIASFP